MIDGTLRSCAFGLLASTALGSPAFAQTGVNDTPPSPATQVAQDGNTPDNQEIIVTAQKREENLSRVPISIQAIGTRRLDQLNISNFEQYTKQLPSVSFQTSQPGQTVVYMRGVATGGDGNHSGSFPSVGSYLDEQPVTTIGGTLDVHIYDIARIESLAGPQGTLYGASSEAGTIRIITNKPRLGVTEGRIDVEGNTVAHGGQGGKIEGMINLPIADRIAFRGVGFYKHDAGYVDNVPGSRSYYIYSDSVDDVTINNAALAEKNFNDVDLYGGRAALKIDLDDNWTVTPTVLYQNQKSHGSFASDPALGDLKIDRQFEDLRRDKFYQAALTVEGKIGNFDITYAGAYLDRKTYTASDYTDYTEAYDRLYADYGGLGYFYYLDNAGNNINPAQRIIGTDHFKKMSHEFRVASPTDNPFRVIVGAFYQRQSNAIFQDYIVDALGSDLSVNGRPGTAWLTQQKRVDKDYALFGEASFDFTPQLTLTAGGRLYKFDNTLIGFFGFGRNPNVDPDDGRPFTATPFNVFGSSRTGVGGCYLANGQTVRDAYLSGAPIANILPAAVAGSPCTNLGTFVDGKVIPKRTKDSGFTHKLNLTWKPTGNALVYATWSRGFRPGGINRRGDFPPYAADYLTNYELGWKLTLADGSVRWNGAAYQQQWKNFQYSYLGENSFTIVRNGPNARIRGIESDVSYTGGGLTLNAAAAYTNAKTRGNLCYFFTDAEDCSTNPLNPSTPNFVSAPPGARLPVTPKFKATATARYSWDAFVGAKAHVQGAVAYQGSAPSDLRSLVILSGPNGGPADPRQYIGKIRSAALFDLATGLDWKFYSFELFAQNLFDKRNDLSRGVACSVCTRALIVTGRPRIIGLRAGVKF